MTTPRSSRPRAVALALLAGLALTACGEPPSEPLGLGPAPAPPAWEAGFAREWFYPAHLDKAGNDRRWAHLAAFSGRPAPELALDRWRPAAPGPDELRGRVVLLDFWATWCPDCAKSVPALNALRETFADEPFTLLGVCAPKGAARFEEVARATGIAFPTGVDTHGDMERAFGVPRWPYHVLLDADGVIRAAGLDTRFLEEAVRHLLAEERARGALRD